MISKVEVDPKAPFSIATTLGVGKGATPFSGLLRFTLDTYHVLLSVKPNILPKNSKTDLSLIPDSSALFIYKPLHLVSLTQVFLKNVLSLTNTSRTADEYVNFLNTTQSA